MIILRTKNIHRVPKKGPPIMTVTSSILNRQKGCVNF